MTRLLTDSEQRALVTAAARAPSAHNTQPARWTFTGDSRVVLLAAEDRTLPAADPTRHDFAAALGAAWEGLLIAMSGLGIKLGAPDHTPRSRRDLTIPAGLACVCSAAYSEGATPDPDLDAATTRRSWRGLFAPPPADLGARLSSLPVIDAVSAVDRPTIDRLAALHDDATVRFMRDHANFAETRAWIRFSESDPRWERDGLTAAAMAWSPTEAWLANAAMRWPFFRLMGAIGADKLMVSEAPAVRSALALVAFTPPRDLSPFEAGRRFYRLWLALERAGLAACPMSASCDDPATRALIMSALAIPADRAPRNLLRVGVAPRERPLSPRLPVAELLTTIRASSGTR